MCEQRRRKPIYTDEILDQIIAAAADQRPHEPKELPENEIDIGPIEVAERELLRSTDEALRQIMAGEAYQPLDETENLPGDEEDIDPPSDLPRTFVRQRRREALRERLEAAVEHWLLATKIAARPSQLSMANEFKADESKLYDALRAVLPADPVKRKRKHAAYSMGMRDGDARQEIVGLYRLYRAARSARKRKQAKPKIPAASGTKAIGRSMS